MPGTGAGRDLGLYPAADFRLTSGVAADGPTSRQALWYFRDETIAVPIDPKRVASFAPGVRVDDDLRDWISRQQGAVPFDHPPLVWVAAPDVISDARLDAGANRLCTASDDLAFHLVPRIALNRSYFDASSARYLAARKLKVRGTISESGIVARTLWPDDFRLDDLPPTRALPTDLPATLALRQRIRTDAQGGARSPFASETLWRRNGASGTLRGRAVVGIMLNGAQGDDDEAHAGHFALVTGRVQDDGMIGDWLANNFYTLDSQSEKGILAAPVPLDNYLADLNAGQAWYRPSYMLVAALSDDRAALWLQAALGRVYNQFWRHQIVYYHPTTNCTSLSVDTLSALGFDVPRRGPTSRVLGALRFPWLLLKERSVAKALLGVDYVWEEQTRMLPAAAFEEIGARLLALVAPPSKADPPSGMLAKMLASDVDALIYLQIPQLPSSRAWGDAPVATLREYEQRLPRDRAKVKTVPVPPRPFPEFLRDPDLVRPLLHASDAIAALWGCLSIVGIPWVVRHFWRRWRARAQLEAL
jgi:hypothetical protein